MYRVLSEENNNLKVEINDFNPFHTFLCGQCFRWDRKSDGHWTGVALGRVLSLLWDGRICIFYNTSKQEFMDKWVKYFDLETDYGEAKKLLSKKDEYLREAIMHGNGIRLLRQDFYETLFSFLISQNNNIPRIKRIIESLSMNLGEPLDNSRYRFPEITALADAPLEKLNICRGGYRCRYISDTAKKLRDLPSFCDDCDYIYNLPAEKAREILLSFPGVGPKVADCVLLYSGIDRTAFPIDRWVKRVMETLYFKKETDEKTIRQFSREYFGELSGIAQQYLFYYAREKRIGL